MRTLLALAACMVLVAGPRPSDAGGFGLGAQFYGIKSSLTGNLPEGDDWRARNSMGASLMLEANASSVITISFQPGLAPRDTERIIGLEPFGGDEDGSETHVPNYDLTYLSLPLVLRVAGEAVGTRGFVTAGLDYALLVSAETGTDANPKDVSDSFKDQSLSALFGAGVQVPVGRHSVLIELRYVQSLEDMIERGNVNTLPGAVSPSVKHRALRLMAGFVFSLGGH